MDLSLKTRSQSELVDITAQVRRAVADTGVREGLCLVSVPHTTAGVAINEAADPNVADDILMVLNQMVPWHAGYRHQEGNSAAHVKSSLVGASQTLAIANGELMLGTWQGIFFCEFDGPRRRQVHVRVLEGQFK
jgi:secondary thiamine-phosphate synthase enzyme